MINIKTYEEFEGITFESYLKTYSVKNLTTDNLNCPGINLRDLEGIEVFKNMTELNCYDNKITSLKGIENLTKLQKLYTHENQIKSLSEIKKLINLEIVCFYMNNLSSLKGIENLINIRELYLGSNQLTSLEGIEKLTNITTLNIRSNNITSLRGIENLTKLDYLYCNVLDLDWVDYIDKRGNKWYIELPKSITYLDSDKFCHIKEYWEFMDKNQPIAVSRKFNF